MKTKRGVSLVVLVITIIVTVILTSIVVLRTATAVEEVEINDFAFEIATIEDKVKEYNLLKGELPVVLTSQYSFENIQTLLTDSKYKQAFIDEVKTNKDENNMFYLIDIDALKLNLDERGIKANAIDIFVVATNTMNVYYLAGVKIGDEIYFSLAKINVENKVDSKEPENSVDGNIETTLALSKNTSTWTDELKIFIQTSLATDETLQYLVANSTLKAVGTNKTVVLNKNTMTANEKAAFESNKTVTINKLKNGVVTETKTINIDNLDITSPSLGDITMVDTSSSEYNKIKIVATDAGLSGIKAIYYDYVTVLKDNKEVSYYTGRSDVSINDLISFGKASKDGNIQLDKNIKSIVVVVVDNAGNTSDIKTYTIQDTYLISK